MTRLLQTQSSANPHVASLPGRRLDERSARQLGLAALGARYPYADVGRVIENAYSPARPLIFSLPVRHGSDRGNVSISRSVANASRPGVSM